MINKIEMIHIYNSVFDKRSEIDYSYDILLYELVVPDDFVCCSRLGGWCSIRYHRSPCNYWLCCVLLCQKVSGSGKTVVHV